MHFQIGNKIFKLLKNNLDYFYFRSISLWPIRTIRNQNQKYIYERRVHKYIGSMEAVVWRCMPWANCIKPRGLKSVNKPIDKQILTRLFQNVSGNFFALF